MKYICWCLWNYFVSIFYHEEIVNFLVLCYFSWIAKFNYHYICWNRFYLIPHPVWEPTLVSLKSEKDNKPTKVQGPSKLKRQPPPANINGNQSFIDIHKTYDTPRLIAVMIHNYDTQRKTKYKKKRESKFFLSESILSISLFSIVFRYLQYLITVFSIISLIKYTFLIRFYQYIRFS